MADTEAKYPPWLQKFFVLIYSFTNRAIGGVALAGMALAIKSKDLDVLVHVSLVSLGNIQLMSQGVLAMHPGSGWEDGFPEENKRRIHWKVQALATTLATSGTIYAIVKLNTDNRISIHGIMGFTTMFFTALSVIAGYVHMKLSQCYIAKYSKICHSIIGCITMTSAFTTYIMGMQKSITISNSNKAVYLYIFFAVISIIGILTTPLTKVVRKAMIVHKFNNRKSTVDQQRRRPVTLKSANKEDHGRMNRFLVLVAYSVCLAFTQKLI